jgi:hypothetical protein
VAPASSNPAAPEMMATGPSTQGTALPTSSSTKANPGVVTMAEQATNVSMTHSEAQSMLCRQEVETALKSTALTPDQRTCLHTIRNRFKFLENGVLDMLIGFAGRMEV